MGWLLVAIAVLTALAVLYIAVDKDVKNRHLVVFPLMVCMVSSGAVGFDSGVIHEENRRQALLAHENIECGKQRLGEIKTGDYVEVTVNYPGSHRPILLVVDLKPEGLEVRRSPMADTEKLGYGDICANDHKLSLRIVTTASPDFDAVVAAWARQK